MMLVGTFDDIQIEVNEGLIIYDFNTLPLPRVY